jgi:hypothetical protein
MISNIDFHSPHRLPPTVEESYQQLLKALAHNYEKTKALIWKQAMIIANGGTPPSPEEVKRRATQIIDKEGTTYLLWDHPPIKQGDSVDLNYAIAELKKPTL